MQPIIEVKNYTKNAYNKLANYVYLHDQVNNKVNDHAPKVYMTAVNKFNGAYGNEIKSINDLKKNLRDNAIPEMVIEGTYDNYLDFLRARALLMSLKIKDYYEKL